MAKYASVLISTAKAEDGYLEKKTNSQLESKTANAGKNNYTKYGKWFGMNGVYWCCEYVSWCFNKAFGNCDLMYGKSASCETTRQAFIKNKRYDSTPKAGDLIFFKGSRHSGANHIGIVTKVASGKVYTIEGNTSSDAGVVDNGGAVNQKTYAVGYSSILGYGHPKYDAEKANTASPSYTKTQFIKDVEKIVGVTVDGKYDTKLASKLVTLSTSKNTKHGSVRCLQKYLNTIGYSCGTIDGVYGTKTRDAVKKYQKAKSITVDGVVGSTTWKKLMA